MREDGRIVPSIFHAIIRRYLTTHIDFSEDQKALRGAGKGEAQRVDSATTRLMYSHKIIHETMREPRIAAPTNPAEEVDLAK